METAHESQMNFKNVGRMVKLLRDQKLWTQELLAEAADMKPRTVQRVEAGQAISKESLLAIAGALDVDAGALDVDLDAVAAAVEQLKRDHDIVDLVVVAEGEDMGRFLPFHALHYDVCRFETDEQRQAARAFEAALEDAEMAWDIDARARAMSIDEIQEALEALATSGLVVTAGQHRVRLKLKTEAPGSGMDWHILIVLLSPTTAPRLKAAWKKKGDVQFT